MTTTSWDDELAGFAKAYAVGEEAVRRRRATWAASVPTVLLTLERAAEILRQNGLEQASAKRHVLGTNIESVQLYTGAEKGAGLLLEKGPDGKPAIVLEVGSTLGYSLGVSGHVMRWFRRHWLTGMGADHPPWDTLEMLEGATALTQAVVEKHVVSFLKQAWETSYRGATVTSRGPIGFVWQEEGEFDIVPGEKRP